ncbi:MAG TPA: class D sortase [Candidatus Saccharimonadales bacterium]|nr:class D sortase [Candidatus Saccharimonadales bacterium]
MDALFPDEPSQPAPADNGYVLPHSKRRIEPDGSSNPAADLIRSKIEALYGDEPNARQERAEAEAAAPRSKHQTFMHGLSTSGKSLAEIQSAWHAYYVKLPDDEKREVWQEFYAANGHATSPQTQLIQQRSGVARPHKSLQHAVAATKQAASATNLPASTEARHTARAAAIAAHAQSLEKPVVVVAEHEHTTPKRPSARRSVAAIRRQVLARVRASNNAQIKAKQHLQSLAFGFGLAALVVVIFLFSFFNEVIIAPFIQPNNHAEATPIILSQGSLAPNATPEVIIPKTNVQLPTIYGTSVNEDDVENSLQDGVVHYSSTSVPGQQGNAAFFGHSSNNIFNKGKYKFAFVLLHELVPGDIFYLTYNGKVYTYRVFQKQIVEPTDTWVLNPVAGKTATAALITCDPPGTSLHRLVVWGEQVDPDPNTAAQAPAATVTAQQPSQLASNGPTLLGRLWHWATPW